MKFRSTIIEENTDAFCLLERIKEVTNHCGQGLNSALKSVKGKENDFLETAMHFTRINYEAQDSIYKILEMGHISEGIVLLRWLLEIGHLYYYLWQNEDEFIKWLNGKEIRPSTVRIYLEKHGYATWRNVYGEWSDITHANCSYIKNCFTISRMAKIDKGQKIILSQALRNLMYCSQKINLVTGNILKELLPIESYNEIASECNNLENEIEAYSNKHNLEEKKYVNGH